MFREFGKLKRPEALGAHWVYSLEFWPSLAQPPVFAACGGRRITLCEIQQDICVSRAFCDEDEKEDFYCCAFTTTTSAGKEPLLCVGGESGTIKILHLETCTLHSFLQGHGGAVYDMKLHPSNADLLFSCSKDESIRVWSISRRKCLLVFAGDEGHRDAVLSISIHPNALWLASSGLDNSIKVWELDSELAKQAMGANSASNPRAAFVQFPAFSTRRVHTDYVDCVHWVGDLLVSKSIESKCVLWKPDVRRRKDGVVLCATYEYDKGTCWFTRFAISADGKLLCVGGDVGGLTLFALPNAQDGDGRSLAPSNNKNTALLQRIKPGEMNKQVRNVKFSPDGQYLISAGDDGVVWCFKKS